MIPIECRRFSVLSFTVEWSTRATDALPVIARPARYYFSYRKEDMIKSWRDEKPEEATIGDLPTIRREGQSRAEYAEFVESFECRTKWGSFDRSSFWKVSNSEIYIFSPSKLSDFHADFYFDSQISPKKCCFFKRARLIPRNYPIFTSTLTLIYKSI